MRTLIALALTVYSLSACAGVGSNVWPNTVKCTGPVAGALVQQVEAILIQGVGTDIGAAAIAALEKLATQYGPDLVACIIEQFIAGSITPGGDMLGKPRSDAAARGQDFLNRKGVAAVMLTRGG
jgi:hypothetical protein